MLRFDATDLPPALALWSVTLSDADRFLYANALNRHAVGDRTKGLQQDADGGLTLFISHHAPADQRNWLPAPAGPYYLVLRLYQPRDDVRGWRTPPVKGLPA